MKLHLIFIYIILLVAPVVSLAQTVVEFPVKTIDIGNVTEDTDSVNCVFEWSTKEISR